MPPRLELSDIRFGNVETDLFTVPEEIFFADLAKGTLRSNVIPLPEGVHRWMRAMYQGQDIHAAHVGEHLYVLADTKVFGFALFHFVSENENATSFRVAYSEGQRIICTERSQVIMSSLQQAASQWGANRQPSVNPMSLSGGNQFGGGTTMPNEGLGGGVDLARVKKEAQARGYVAGYIMGNAPQLSMYLKRNKSKDGTVSCDICARESKPSRMLSVMMALPANCVTRNGGLASPADIAAGAIDFNNTDPNEMLYLDFPVSQAITYIFNLGGQLPEYAPNVTDRSQHWTKQDILGGKPEVTYVYVKPIERRGKAAQTEGRFNFALKSTSGRRSLFTPNNHVCLRALEHIPTRCNTEQDAYNLNQNAFGAWAYRRKKAEPETALQRAMRECPSAIWKQQYTIKGENGEPQVVNGIGSAFFMVGSETKTESGESVSLRSLGYTPWYATGDQRQEVPSKVERIVKRVPQAADSNHKENMVVVPVLYRENPTDKLFSPYKKFISFITSKDTPFISEERLRAMGTRTKKATGRILEFTDDQKNALQFYMNKDSVLADMEQVRDEVARRAVMNATH